MIVLFNKPYGVLSQFTDETGRANLKQYVSVPNVYPAGRLDKDSEGLLVLTDDAALQHRITDPKHKMSKTYWVQVEGCPGESDCCRFNEGIELSDGRCRPAKCARMAPPANLWQRQPPIRVRRSVPDNWLSVTLREGKNRQVRRMCAAVGFPVLRLIRYRVGSWTIDGLAQGQFHVVD